MRTIHSMIALAVALAGLALPAQASLTDAEAARLGAELTPIGAEKAGNKDGTIPAWSGGLTAPPSGWTAAQGYVDPFAADKVKFTITGANVGSVQGQADARHARDAEEVRDLQDAGLRDAAHGGLPAGGLRRGQVAGDEGGAAGFCGQQPGAHHRAVPDPEERPRGHLEPHDALPRRRHRS